MTKKFLVSILVVLGLLVAPNGLFAQGGQHLPSSATLPTHCTVADLYYKTGSAAGLYVCMATDTWTLNDSGGGSVGTTGSPASGNLAKFSGASSITNVDLSGDVSTSGTAVTTIGSSKVTNAMLAGSIAASKLVGSDIATVGTITSGTWTGTAIALANGGTGLTSAADDTVMVSSGSAWVAKTLPDCTDAGGNHINYTQSTNTLSCGTSGATSGTVTPSSSDTLTNKVIDAEGTGNTITIPFTYYPVLAVCQNTTALLGGSTPTANPAVAACVTGTNTNFGVLQFADGANALSVQGHFALASDWTGNIDVKGKWYTSATSGSVVWQIKTICVADAETSDPSWNTASTVTDAAKGTTLQLNDFSMTSITITGCAAGEELFYQFFRDPANGSDDLAATANLVDIYFIVRRAM